MPLFVGDICLVLPLKKSAVYAGAEYSSCVLDYNSISLLQDFCKAHCVLNA